MPLQEEGYLENYLIEKAGTDIELKQNNTKQIMFTKKRLNIPNSYTIGLYHPYVDSVLAEVHSLKYDSKIKHVKLYSPELEIEFRNTGKLGLATEYEFHWENDRYIWRKGPLNKELECKLMPEKGPGIGVAIFNPKKKHGQLGTVTVMYFNMDRLEVSDKKGLEHVILISLLSILDRGDGLFTRKNNASASIPAAQVSPTVASPRENESKKLDKRSKSDEDVATDNPAQPTRASPYSAATPYTNDTLGRPYPNARFSMYPEQSSPQYSNYNNRPATLYDTTAIDYSRMTQGFPSVVSNGTSAYPNVYYPNGGYSNHESTNPISPIQQQYSNPFPHPYQQQQYSYQYAHPQAQPQLQPQHQYLPQTQAQPQMQPQMQPQLPPQPQHQYPPHGQAHPQVQSQTPPPSQHQYLPHGGTQTPPIHLVSPVVSSNYADKSADIYPATADPFSDASAYTVNSSAYPPDSSSIASATSTYNYNTHATHPPLAPIITNPAILKVAQPLHRSATSISRSSTGSTSSLHRTLTMTSRGSPSASEKSSQSVDGSSSYFSQDRQTDDSYIYPAQPIVAPLDPIVSSPFAESRGHTDITYDSPRSAKREGFMRMELPTSPTTDSYDGPPRVKGLNISRVGTNGERPTILMPEPTIGTP
ncbi:5559_t:CDS:2 [Paraglomus occultum]|uniref:5559_t:CDS:1 n=1 Tax=Paraglomus occultum TaxID=144539 RepID=A0A9N9FIX6_9GLOM|nr:5559_t:CDS:2 [Paraglomus occultum]